MKVEVGTTVHIKSNKKSSVKFGWKKRRIGWGRDPGDKVEIKEIDTKDNTAFVKEVRTHDNFWIYLSELKETDKWCHKDKYPGKKIKDFKVGMKVKVINFDGFDGSSILKEEIGTTGFITQFSETSPPIRVRHDGYAAWWYPNNLKIISNNPKKIQRGVLIVGPKNKPYL